MASSGKGEEKEEFLPEWKRLTCASGLSVTVISAKPSLSAEPSLAPSLENMAFSGRGFRVFPLASVWPFRIEGFL